MANRATEIRGLLSMDDAQKAGVTMVVVVDIPRTDIAITNRRAPYLAKTQFESGLHKSDQT